MTDDLVTKTDSFIVDGEKILKKGYIFEDDRAELSSKIRGFIRGAFGENREEEYLKFINSGISNYRPNYHFDKKTKHMLLFLHMLKEELIARTSFQNLQPQTFEKLTDDVQKNKAESERRENVAGIKYWGFAIELIETVRKELKIFREAQEKLLGEMIELRKDIAQLKERFETNSKK